MNSNFEIDLRDLINKYNKELSSNTPDFVLVEYLISCLENFDKTVKAREKWYGRDYVEVKGLCHSAEIVHKKS